MKNIVKLIGITLVSGLFVSCASTEQKKVHNERIVTNPIDLNYRFSRTRSRGVKLPTQYWNILRDIITCLLPSQVVTGVRKIWLNGSIFPALLFRPWKIMLLPFLFMVIRFTLLHPAKIPGFSRMPIQGWIHGKK